jgi:hypothetical protein
VNATGFRALASQNTVTTLASAALTPAGVRIASRSQAGGAHPLHLDAHPELPVGVADLGAQVDLRPRHHVVRVAAERLHVEGVPPFLQVGQEHRVVDVPQCVDIPPPQADLMLEDRVHTLTLSPPGTASVIAAPTRRRRPDSPGRHKTGQCSFCGNTNHSSTLS